MIKVFKEKRYTRAAQYILSMNKDQFEQEVFDVGETNHDGDKWDFKAYFRDVQNLAADIAHGDEDSIATVYYKFPLSQDAGRLYVKCFSIQSLQHRIRSLLVRDFVVDIDMVNAHPTILVWLCKQHDLDCPYLEQYVNNRAEMLKKNNLNKFDIIIATYQDKPHFSKNKWFSRLLSELCEIRDFFHEIRNQFPGLSFTTKEKKNPKSSDLSKILAKFENIILQKAVAVIGAENVHTLFYDGFHLDIGAFNDETVPRLNEATAEYGIKWSKKGFDTDIVVPEDFKFNIDDATDYKSKKLVFERNHAFIYNTASYISRPHPQSDWIVSNQRDFVQQTMNVLVPGDKGPEPIYKQWMQDAGRKQYDKVDFMPTLDCPANVFNLFQGIASEHIEKEKRVSTEILHKHLMQVICNGDERLYKYLINYEAHMVQKICERPDVALVIKGLEGAGKESLQRKWAKMIGSKYFRNTANMHDVFGEFNSDALLGKLVFVFNEVEGKDGFQFHDKIKDLITKETLALRDLYKAKIHHTNYMRFIFITNNLTPVNITPNDRRFQMFATSPCWIGDVEKWTAYHSAIEDQAVLNSYYSELMDVDISNFHPSRDRVITDAYKATQTRLISDIHHLLRDTFAPADGPQEPTAFKYKKVSNLWVVTPSKFQDELKSWGQRRYGDSYEGKRDGKQVLAQLQEIDGFDSNKSCRLEDYQHPVKVYAFDREAVCEYLDKYVFKHFSAETEEVL